LQQGQTRQDMFNGLDTNKDGSISRAEAAAAPALVVIFADTDKNADGQLSAVEFEVVPLTNADGSAAR
jgi:Ca2+-binding EF-hand superfamily protein